MDSVTIIRSLFEHNYWALDRILVATAGLRPEQFRTDAGMPHGSLWATLFHAVGAEWLWIERCRGRSPGSFLPEPESRGLEAIAQLWKSQRRTALALIDSVEQEALSHIVNYTTLGGVSQSNLLGHILLHVATHTAQHRAEAAQILTQVGHSPHDLDFDEYIEAAL